MSVATNIVSDYDNAVRENTQEASRNFKIVSDAPEVLHTEGIVELIASKIE